MTALQSQISDIGLEKVADIRSVRSWSDDLQLQSFANFAHELRTPVQVLLGYLDMLIADEGVERNIIERMNVNVHELAQTVENVLDFTLPLDESVVPLQQEIELATFFSELEEVLLAARRKSTIAIRVDLAEAPRAIVSRQRALRSIVLNLASNAIKFTEHGEVAIVARHSDGDPPLLLLEIRDTGPGISADLMSAAFEPMVQLSQSSIRRHRGLGLGLTVVQRNIRALGGSLAVESTPGVGSCFRVTIPCAISQQQVCG